MRKSLVSLEAVTHTTVVLNNQIASNCKTFNVPINIEKKSKIDCILYAVIFRFLF